VILIFNSYIYNVSYPLYERVSRLEIISYMPESIDITMFRGLYFYLYIIFIVSLKSIDISGFEGYFTVINSMNLSYMSQY
jgi:hypothetical protein